MDDERSLSQRARAWLRARADGLRSRAAHLRQYVGRLRTDEGPTTRQSVLRSLGRAEPESQPAAVGETCDRPRTDDSGLPWRTFRWYGGWGGHAYWETSPGVDRTPVVFVHGNGGDACNWNTVADHLHEQGYRGDELWAITFGSFTPTHPEMSAQLEDFVGHVLAETGAEEVSLVAHSLGVTGVRYWPTDRGRYDSVARVVGLGGANDGTCGCPGCYESEGAVGPDEAIRACRSVARQCREETGHPLAVLSTEPDTPGDVEYVMIRGRLDPIYWCDRTSPYLDGAENVAVGTTHMGLLKRRETVRSYLG